MGHRMQNGSRPQVILALGQVGVDKLSFLEAVAGEIRRVKPTSKVEVLSVGEMMYAEDPSVPKGRILFLPKGQLRALRRGVFRDIIARRNELNSRDVLIISSHATFRWSHGLFSALDRDMLLELNPDLILNVIENFHQVWSNLARDHTHEHNFMDVLVAREMEGFQAKSIEEYLFPGNPRLFISARGKNNCRATNVAQLLLSPDRKRVYPSFPMTHVMDLPEVLADINRFRGLLADRFIVSDPGDVDEKDLLIQARSALSAGQEFLSWIIDGTTYQLSTADLVAVEREVDNQICSRDYALIDQSDFIVSLVPELPNGKPALSSGVERELEYTYRSGKEVFVVWYPKRDPSPFITNHVTAWARSVDELLARLPKSASR